jgi:hypothetical protein
MTHFQKEARMRWLAGIGLSAFGVTVAMAAGSDQGNARGGFQQDYPQASLYQDGSRITRVYGSAFGFGSTPEESAAAFVQSYAALFGVGPANLVPGNHFNDVLTQPVMYDPDLGDYKSTLVYYAQYQDGVPVYRSELRLLVLNTAGYPLVLAASSLRDLGDFTVPAGAAAGDPGSIGHAQALALLPDLQDFMPSSFVVWAGIDDINVPPTLAVQFIADNGLAATGQYEKRLFLADAASGAILHWENLVLNTDVTGSVHGLATTIPKADICNPEVDTVMPYARVSIGSTSVYADANGNFTIPNSGSTPVTVTSYVSGKYFNVSDQAGPLETLTLSVTPPGPADFMHNSANSSEFIRAQVNGYVQCNVVRDWTLVQNPTYPTIYTQQGFQVNVNLNQTCNAYYDGTLNLYRSGGGCANTAYSNVIHHEYGHHIVAMGGSGQDEYGEGMGDTVAALIANDPVLGYGFQNNCSAGIRNANNNCQYQASGCSSCGSEIHDCGQLLSGCVWSTRTNLMVTNPDTYLAIISDLTINSVLLHSGGSINPSICIDFLTLDDNDGDLSNGTPHFTEITNGFAAHGMWQGLPPDNDLCSQAVVACTGTYTGSTSGLTTDGSASCGTSDSTPDAWFKYTPTTSGTLSLLLCDSDYDTVLSVHTGCPGNTGNQVGCNDDTGWFGACGWLPTSQSALDVSVSAYQTYYIRISGYNGATGNYVLDVSGPACVPPDTTPPTPNPMTWAAPPAPSSSTAISMTATTATDAASPPVQYEFEFVSGGSGGTSSGWQSPTQYTDTGLAPDTTYTYRVRARDSASPPNNTQFSANATTATYANVPGAPTLSNPMSSTLQLDVNPNGNPAYTGFAVRCTAASPADPAWSGTYVSATGQPSAGEVWRTDAQWGTITVTGLQPATLYTFAVKARNMNGIETALGPSSSLATTGYALGDLNCDGAVNAFDIDPFVLALTDPPGYAAQYPNCNYMLGDINGDGAVNAFDIDPFVDLLTK